MKVSNGSMRTSIGRTKIGVVGPIAGSVALTLLMVGGILSLLALTLSDVNPARAAGSNIEYMIESDADSGAMVFSSEAPQGLFDLVINEFMAANSGSATDPVDMSTNEDWVEIYNPTDQAVNLQGLYISDTLADPIKHQITVTLFIQPQSHLLFWADNESEQGPTHLPFKFKAGGEAIALYAPNGTTEIDSYIFGAQQENVSEGRTIDGGTTWTKYLTATPGRSNTVFPEISTISTLPALPLPQQSVGVSAVITDDTTIVDVTLFYSTTDIISLSTTPLTSLTMNLNAVDTYRVQLPGMPDNTLVSYYIQATDSLGNVGIGPKDAPASTKKYLVGYNPPTLRINEVMPSNASVLEDPQEPLEFPDWVEIYNYGNFSVSLNGIHLSDDSEEPDKYAIPSGLIMPPRTYLVFFADDDGTQGPLHTNFKLNESDTIGLYGPYGAYPIDVVSPGNQPSDTSVGRFPDGIGSFGAAKLCATPNSRNRLCNRSTYLPIVER